MKYLVVFMLTFMDGSYYQLNDVEVKTRDECVQYIKQRVQDMKQNIGLWRKTPSTFITGCILKD